MNGRTGTGARLVAGVDEAGRGPLAGPVVAAAVILDPGVRIEGLTDSKRLSAGRRTDLDHEIRECALSFAVARVGATVIDTINILQATMQAMREAIDGLDTPPDEVLVDGDRCPALPYPARAVVRGDVSVAAISAASVLAKVARDQEMIEMDRRYPEYGFARHKGYGTRAHRDALARFGPSPIHRTSFAPVQSVLFRNLTERDRS
ncbi:MAG: ribonuclease HII [Thiotrichales bacterium]|nr:ribonuclease HII [Thiotrichales bacterium]MCY4285794.1 ribonuclease HII [Thiotrichales bacterium]MCY4349293.1 ribonuclease HII [Thiotrichales bacterium]